MATQTLAGENFTDMGNFPRFMKEICTMKELFVFRRGKLL
jgi:hypothetical protein